MQRPSASHPWLVPAISLVNVIEESVPGAIVSVELIIFAVLFQLFFVLVDLLRRGTGIVVSK